MYELKEWQLEERYENMLNELYPEVKIGEHTFSPAEILRRCDDVAYRTGMHDYANQLIVEDGVVIEGYE